MHRATRNASRGHTTHRQCLSICDYYLWLWLFRIGIVCDVTCPTKLSSHVNNCKWNLSMKNIRILSFSLYPPYANSPEKSWAWSGYWKSWNFYAHVIRPKMSNIRWGLLLLIMWEWYVHDCWPIEWVFLCRSQDEAWGLGKRVSLRSGFVFIPS